MPPHKHQTGRASSADFPPFDVTLEDLRTLMEFRGDEAREKIDADYGSTEAFCQRLQTDPNNGIPNNADELNRLYFCYIKSIIFVILLLSVLLLLFLHEIRITLRLLSLFS